MNFIEKPFQLIFMFVFGFLALLGLLLFANFRGTPGTAAVGNVTIWGTLPEYAMTQQLNALKKAEKEYGSVSYEQKSPETFGADLAEALASNVGPDLVLISQEELVSQQNKLSVIPFSTISERSYLDSFVPITELYLTDKGTYGIPLVVDPLVLFYNRTLLSSNGVPVPPASWEAVTGLAERLTQKNNGQVVKSAVALGEYANITNARAIISLLLLQSGTKISEADGTTIRSVMTQSSTVGLYGINPAESALSFYTQFADPAKTVYSWNRALPESRQAFLSGDLALYIGFASEVTALQAGNPNLDFDMARIPQPQTSTTRTTYGLAYAFAIPKASKNPAGALASAQALTTREGVAPAILGLGMAPALRALLASSAPDNRYQPIYFPEALTAKGWLSPSPSATDNIFSVMIGNITTGRKGIGQALTTADQAIDSAY
jgi:multiple sugar transport system substrate-binding protein